MQPSGGILAMAIRCEMGKGLMTSFAFSHHLEYDFDGVAFSTFFNFANTFGCHLSCFLG